MPTRILTSSMRGRALLSGSALTDAVARQHEAQWRPSTPATAERSPSGTLPDRAGSAEVSLPGHQIAGPQGAGQTRWTMRWKSALNAFGTFGDRMPKAENH